MFGKKYLNQSDATLVQRFSVRFILSLSFYPHLYIIVVAIISHTLPCRRLQYRVTFVFCAKQGFGNCPSFSEIKSHCGEQARTATTLSTTCYLYYLCAPWTEGILRQSSSCAMMADILTSVSRVTNRSLSHINLHEQQPLIKIMKKKRSKAWQ